MPFLTLLAGTALAGTALTGAILFAPAEPPCPPDGEPSTAMTRYACSLSYWHRHPDWGFALPAPPAHAPSCAGSRGDG